MPFIGAPRSWQASEPLDPAAWVPLSSLAVEGFGASRIDDTIEARTRRLARQLAAEVLLDDIGRACVPRAVAREMFAERAERDQRQREQKTRLSEELKAQQDHRQAQLKALQDRQARMPDLGDLPLHQAALASMTADDYNARVEKHSSHMDDMMRGGLTYHDINEKE